MVIFKALNEIIFPERCIVCRTLGVALCIQCRRSWNHNVYMTEIAHGDTQKLSVISSVPYSSISSKILLAAKESHIKSADQFVSQAITHSIHNARARMRFDYLVPIPSRKSAARKRGRQFIEEMTVEASKLFSLPILNPLKHVRQVRDQSGLDSKARWNNLEGSLVADTKLVHSVKALLVDDLVTTGATLNEAARALRYAGIEVSGAVTAAVALTSKIPHVL
jgi:predicted amidophosphoribosyltransferase